MLAGLINDIHGDLVNLYRVVKQDLEGLLKCFEWTLVSRNEFNRLRKTDPGTLTDLQRAARFLYLQKMAFGGKLNDSYGTSTTDPPRLNLLRIEEELSRAHLRLSRVNVEQLDWRECLRRYDRPYTLFYLDPPYFGSENDYGKNLFSRSDFKEMSAILKTLEGNFILSLSGKFSASFISGGFPSTIRPANRSQHQPKS